MSMASLAELKNIWATKEYRVLPTIILEYLRNDTNINDAAIICWQTLFELSYFNTNWQLEISKAELGAILRKSQTTIGRTLHMLESNNYIKRNTSKSGNAWCKSIITVRFPRTISELSENKKNRKAVEASNHKNIESTKEKGELKIEVKNGLSHTNTVNEILPTGSAFQAIDTHNECHEVEAKKDKELSIIGDYTINNIIYNNNNNNDEAKKTVVVFLEDKIKSENIQATLYPEKLTKLEKKLEQMEKQLRDDMQNAYQNLHGIESYNRTKELSEQESMVYTQRLALEREKRKWKKEQANCIMEKALSHDVSYIQQLGGERNITSTQIQRITKQLKQLNLNETELLQRINEIVYEIRFGSLMFQQGNQKPLSIEHAINIALKLVREDRWTTPKDLQVKLKQITGLAAKNATESTFRISAIR